MQGRALGDYAEQAGNKDAKKLVDDFFITSQDFDFTLFQAKRNNEPVGEKSDAALQKNLDALQRCVLPTSACSCLLGPWQNSFTSLMCYS